MTDSARLTVAVQAAQCAGSGGCRAAAPDVFGADDEGWVRLLLPHPPLARLDDVLEAQDACPVGVISITDENGRRLE